MLQLILINGNIILFPVYAPLVRRGFPPDVDMFGTKIEENNWTTFSQSYGSLNSSPPPTESPEEWDSRVSSLYNCPTKVNMMHLIMKHNYIKYQNYSAMQLS